MENYIIKDNGKLKYLQFTKLLNYGINHAYTLKTENIDFSRDSEFEKSSYKALADCLMIEENKILKPHQTHTANVKCINELVSSNEIENVDGLITNKPEIALTTKNADCIIFLFYDPVKKVIANVHSGWKGTIQKISEVTVKKMISEYGCNPEEINCFICPSIRKCHFEVDEDVKDLFYNTFNYLGGTTQFIEKGRIFENKQKYNIDTVQINQILLTNLGLKPKNIIDCGLCSVCHKDEIHSARAEGPNFGRATAIIFL